MSAYPYFNEVGEPLMDGAAMRTEMYYDSMGEYDPDDYLPMDDYEPEQVEPSVCTHMDGSYPHDAGYSCDHCWETYEGPRYEFGPLDFPVFWHNRHVANQY